MVVFGSIDETLVLLLDGALMRTSRGASPRVATVPAFFAIAALHVQAPVSTPDAVARRPMRRY